MTAVIVKGALAGLAYGMLLGPLFFMGLKVTLQRGLQNGLALAAGAFVSDAFLAIGSWWSSVKIMELLQQEMFQSIVGTTGALLVMGFGITAIWPLKKIKKDQFEITSGKYSYSFFSGFTLNMANPSNWIFWLGLATAASFNGPENNQQQTLAFLIAALVMVFVTDITKVILADSIGKRLHPELPGKIVQFAGVILLTLGSILLIKNLKFGF
jgi:threonine/homoserine/homoserine lactone efflux protein